MENEKELNKVLSISQYKRRKIYEEDLGFDIWDEEQEKIRTCLRQSNDDNFVKVGTGKGKVLEFPGK